MSARSQQDYEEAVAPVQIESVSINIAAGSGVACRTSPFRVRQLAGATIGEPEWHDGERDLRIDKGVGYLTCQVLVKELLPASSDGDPSGTRIAERKEVVIATTCVDLATVRNGYNYISLFSPGPDSGEDERVGRLLGQVILRLNWVERGAETKPEAAVEHATLLVRGASGLATAHR